MGRVRSLFAHALTTCINSNMFHRSAGHGITQNYFSISENTCADIFNALYKGESSKIAMYAVFIVHIAEYFLHIRVTMEQL
jgi:hypothetical protein